MNNRKGKRMEVCLFKSGDLNKGLWIYVSYFISNLSHMDQQIVSVDKSDLQTFQGYIANFWLFLQLDQKDIAAQLETEKNKSNIVAFASNYDIRFIILQRNREGKVNVELEWVQDMLSSTNILLMKRNNFNLYKEITPFKISEMVQVVNLDFQN